MAGRTLGGRRLAIAAAALGAVMAAPAAAYAVTFGDAELASRASSEAGGASGDHQSFDGALSADGRYVAFSSWAGNLGPDHADLHPDVFLRDTLTGRTTLLSRASDAEGGAAGDGGSWGATISSDGRYVAFTSEAGNLVAGDDGEYNDVFLRDTTTGTTVRITEGFEGDSFGAHISDDGRYVAFSSDADNVDPDTRPVWADAFVWDRVSGETTLLSPDREDPAYHQSARPQAISGDGRYVLLHAAVGDPASWVSTQLFRVDRTDGTTELVSRSDGAGGDMANDSSWTGDLSLDGRYVAFESTGSNLSDQDDDILADIYLRDMTAGTTRLLTLPSDQEWGGMYSATSSAPSISDDGARVAFTTDSDALRGVGPDTDNRSDAVVWDALDDEITIVSHAPFARGGGASREGAGASAISGDGGSIGFGSDSDELTDVDDDGGSDPVDVFVSRALVPSGGVPETSGPPEPGPDPPGPGPDRAPPMLRVTGTGTQTLRRVVRVAATALSEDMWVTAGGRLSAAAGPSAHRLRGTRATFLAHGSRATLKLRLTRRAYRAARRALVRGRRVAARIRVTVHDAAGNQAAVTRTVRLRP
jgi:Tol biopolymer transport system component